MNKACRPTKQQINDATIGSNRRVAQPHVFPSQHRMAAGAEDILNGVKTRGYVAIFGRTFFYIDAAGAFHMGSSSEQRRQSRFVGRVSRAVAYGKHEEGSNLHHLEEV